MKSAYTKSTRPITIKILMLLALSASTLMLLFFFQEYFYLDAAKIIAAEALRYIEINRLQGALIFMAFYFSICALPTPFVSAPTMLAGYLFGNIDGLLIVSFMSALGGTCLFLMARYLCRNWIQKNFTEKFSRLSKVSNANSFSAALSMRLIPGMPFSIPAIALGLSQLSTLKFYCSTQLGLLMILFVYVNAGRSLAEISSVADIFTAQLIISMLLLAIVPLTFAFIARKRKPAFSS